MRHATPVRLAAAALLVLATIAQAQVSGPARVAALTGTLSVRRARQEARGLRLNDTVEPGDELITGENAEAVIRTPDGAAVHIFPDSRVIFSERSPDIRELLHLFLGSIKVHIEKLSGRPNPHKVTTPTAVIAVRGTIFSVFVDETEATLVAVDEGEVSVANVRTPSQEVILRRGQRTWVRQGQPPMQAQRFRGRSERADMAPGRGAGRRAADSSGAHAMGNRVGQMNSAAHRMGGMAARGGPPH